jgi:hypothetical protein
VANFNTTAAQTAWVILDSNLSTPGDAFRILYTNRPAPTAPSQVVQLGAGTVTVAEVDGSLGAGALNVVQITLQPMEAQILRKG